MPSLVQAKFFDAHRTQILDRPNRRMCLAGFAVRGTGERDAHAPFAEVREHAAVEWHWVIPSAQSVAVEFDEVLMLT